MDDTGAGRRAARFRTAKVTLAAMFTVYMQVSFTLQSAKWRKCLCQWKSSFLR